MILFLRIFLIGLIFYLIFSSFIRHAGKSNEPANIEKDDNSKRVSKKTGEYVDYEEMKK
jgi:hypothetical protein